MCQLCFFMTDKNVPGDILKNHIESNFMQSTLIFFAYDKTVPSWSSFALLIKPLCYVLIMHLIFKMLETGSIMHYQ